MNQLDQRAKDSQNERDKELDDLRFILESAQGKRLLNRILMRAGIFTTTYGSGTNTHDFAFLEGRRDMGLFLLGEITQADSDAWLEIQKANFEQIKQLDEKVKHERNYQHTDND